jgi:hypothetical protein
MKKLLLGLLILSSSLYANEKANSQFLDLHYATTCSRNSGSMSSTDSISIKYNAKNPKQSLAIVNPNPTRSAYEEYYIVQAEFDNSMSLVVDFGPYNEDLEKSGQYKENSNIKGANFSGIKFTIKQNNERQQFRGHAHWRGITLDCKPIEKELLKKIRE